MSFQFFDHTDQPVMVANDDRRALRRQRVLLQGKIVYGSNFTADCTIRDLNEHGARVQFPEPQVTPAQLHLIVVSRGVAHWARTAWTGPSMAGLAFERSYDLDGPLTSSMLAIRELWSALASRR